MVGVVNLPGCYTVNGISVHTFEEIGGCPRCGDRVGDRWVAVRRVIVAGPPPENSMHSILGNARIMLSDERPRFYPHDDSD